ncbi:hypothetical protein [Geminocystis sp. GBBB08]|uniref:hypothetical protein n=1 Tax=Geminocystis sp. GBBB08 TaxID=2604140 RepID=UPI0027E318BB|nr:hypothetical protein [Geminocystis sp. GBBB08]MBL1211439.1 hypothetical protein [Geminocystis sp. GBBB08]
MDTQELVNYLDELLYDSTGKHIDSLQVAILKGVLNGEKYKDIAKEYKCSASHAKDEAYKLWRLLSKTLNEDINKYNLKATVDRIIAKNYQFVVNQSKIDKFNFCPNSQSKIEENEDVISDEKILIESTQKKIKRETIPRLMRLGLNAEQIAEALDLPIQEVRKIMS